MLKKPCYSHPNVHIENKKIKQVYQCKTLGVTIDQHLPWKSNTKNICKKICSGIDLCYSTSQTLQYVSKETLISIYYAFVRSYFDYEIFLVKHNRRLQKLQNKAARVILGMTNDVNHTIALCALG